MYRAHYGQGLRGLGDIYTDANAVQYGAVGDMGMGVSMTPVNPPSVTNPNGPSSGGAIAWMNSNPSTLLLLALGVVALVALK